ncbi:unnamed protein product, partial [Chrysoparadoxa australica]
KEAAFYIGDAVTVVTKTKRDPEVRVFTMDEKHFKEKSKSDPERVYTGMVYSKRPGDPVPGIHEDESGLLMALCESEKGQEHFTYMIMRMPYEGSEEDRARVALAKGLRHHPAIMQLVRSLTQTYYFHLHPEEVCERPKQIDAPPLDMQLSLYKNGKVAKAPEAKGLSKRLFPVHLSSVTDDLTSKFVAKAESRFDFTFSLKILPDSPELNVTGRIFYYPYVQGESRPTSQVITVDDSDEDEDRESPRQEGDQDDEAAVSVFWQDRFIPESSCNKLWFFPSMQDQKRVNSAYSQDKIGLKWRNRIKCMLFFHWDAPISSNKLKLNFNLQDTIGGVGDDKKMITPLDPKTPKPEFAKWLAKCHKRFDKETTFSERVADTPVDGSEHGARWNKCLYGTGEEVGKGQHVAIRVTMKGRGGKKRDVYGTVQHFDTLRGAGQTWYAGVGYVSILEDSRPEPLQDVHRLQIERLELATCRLRDEEFAEKKKELNAHCPDSVELFNGQSLVTNEEPLTWSCTDEPRSQTKGLQLYIKSKKGEPVCKLDKLATAADLEVRLV